MLIVAAGVLSRLIYRHVSRASSLLIAASEITTLLRQAQWVNPDNVLASHVNKDGSIREEIGRWQLNLLLTS